MTSPLEFFEQSIRAKEESRGPVPELAIDALLGFREGDDDRLFGALSRYYPAGHWALDRANFRHAVEKAMQLLSAGLCGLGSSDREGPDPLECCARIVNAPTLHAYILRARFNYVVVTTGFVSALERFISSTYGMAAAHASRKDPAGRSAAWDEELLLGSIAALADEDLSAFTRGVFEASVESSMQQVLGGFFDLLAFKAFDREVHRDLMKGMRSAAGSRTLGLPDLGQVLAGNDAIRTLAQKIARLSVCFVVCHEFGHAFPLSIDEEGAADLAADEAFADMIGVLVMYRLIEAGIVPTIVGAHVSPRDFGHALAAFHSWTLSTQLAVLLRGPGHIEIGEALHDIHGVAVRWEKAMALIGKVWTDPVPPLADGEEPLTTGFMIVNQWAVMTAGMLRAVLLKNGHAMDIETACTVLPLLADRGSKLYAHLTA